MPLLLVKRFKWFKCSSNGSKERRVYFTVSLYQFLPPTPLSLFLLQLSIRSSRLAFAGTDTWHSRRHRRWWPSSGPRWKFKSKWWRAHHLPSTKHSPPPSPPLAVVECIAGSACNSEVFDGIFGCRSPRRLCCSATCRLVSLTTKLQLQSTSAATAAARYCLLGFRCLNYMAK